MRLFVFFSSVITCWIGASLWIYAEAEELPSAENNTTPYIDPDSAGQCPHGHSRLEKGLIISLSEGTSHSCCNGTLSCLKCRGEKCDPASSAAVEAANCTYLHGDDYEGQNWTCVARTNTEFKLLDYNVQCHAPHRTKSNITCINEDCCVMYYDVEHISRWYKGWTAIAVITALVILAILLAMLVIHCKTVLKTFHERRRQASENFTRVAFTK